MTSRVSPVRIGVIGFGGFGRLHAFTLAGIPEASLSVIVDADPRRLGEAERILPSVRCVEELAEALQEDPPEAWVIASSTVSHVPLARRLTEAGFPVLVEKPLADRHEEAMSLAECIAADSRNFMMGHIVLFNGEFQRIAGEVAGRSRPSFISCTRHRPSSTLDIYPGENPFSLLMVHDFYSVLALTGAREPSDISARVGRNERGEVNLGIAHFGWDDGSTASFTASFLTPPGMGADGYDRLEVYGPDWAARIDPNPRPLTVWDQSTHRPFTHDIIADTPDEPGNTVSSMHPRGMLADELRCFCRVVRGTEPVPVGARYEDGCIVTRWIEAARQAAGVS